MVDSVSPNKRSEIMRKVRSKDTKPELIVRKLVFKLGYRYRIHRKDLPGNPDLVFFSRKKVIFVHGCFWHQHPGCKNARVPKSRVDFWKSKFAKNIERDLKARKELLDIGWKCLIVWECELIDPRLGEKITAFLED